MLVFVISSEQGTSLSLPPRPSRRRLRRLLRMWRIIGMHALVSRARAASALARAERDPGPSAKSAKRVTCAGPDSSWPPLGPGSRCARPGHERARSRRAKRTVGRSLFSRCQTATHLSLLMVRSAARRVSNHEGTQVDQWPPILRDGPSGLLRMRRCWQSRDVTQHSPLRSRVALRVGVRLLSFASIPQKRGRRSADRRTLLSYVARARRDDRVSETRAVPLQPGRPLGAPSWRFSAGDPCCRLRQWHRSQPATCPHQTYGPMGGVPDLPRCGSRRNRGTPLPAPSSGSSPEDAPSERGWESL